MKIVRIDHIAICVPELEPALAQWQALLGLVAGPREYVPSQVTEAAFVLAPAEGEACVESGEARDLDDKPGRRIVRRRLHSSLPTMIRALRW